MTSRQQPISPDDIYACTDEGVRAAFDTGRALSAGFRQMLKALDGKLTVQELGAKFPKLDQQDMVLWLEELRRLQYIAIAQIPFELPEIKVAKPAPAKAAQKPAASPDLTFEDMAANVADWVKQSTESFVKVRPAELNKTIQMATLQSSQALESLEDSGFIANLMEPINFADFAGSAPAPGARAPAATAPGARAPMATAPKARASPKVPAAKQKNAVVFEDDVADLKVLVGLIGAAGYRVQASSSRQQFVNLLNGTAVPDVMFLKLGSKDVDGFKALEKLRLHPRLKDVAVVMMAAKASREDIAKSILLGASGWMIKPYSADVIAAAVQGVLAFPSHLAVPPA